jgi:hypothetical protein
MQCMGEALPLMLVVMLRGDTQVPALVDGQRGRLHERSYKVAREA